MKKLLFIPIILICSISFNNAQDINKILGQYFENSGGLEKLRAIKSMKINGITPTPQGDFDFVIYRKVPNLMKVEMDIHGQKMVAQAFDGETAWSLNPFMGGNTPKKMPEAATKMIKEDAIIEDPFIDYSKKGHEVIVEGKEDVEGTECIKIKLTRNKNNENEEYISYYYFDAEYMIPIMMKMSMPNGQEVETYFGNYEEIEGGYTMPMSMDVKMGGQLTQSMKIKSYEINVELDDEIFRFPEEELEKQTEVPDEPEEE